MKKTAFITTSLSCLLLIFNSPAYSEIYKWIDDKGKTHFTDKPPTNVKTETVELKINTYTAVEITPLIERLGRADKVVIYTTDWCSMCNRAKTYFRRNNIDYIAYDVEKSTIGKKDYKLLHGKAVPIIIIGKKRMNGFSASRFEALYQDQMGKKNQNKNNS
ncbi:MAG: DUF4124 domain-containing protein [Gammaproteobacteria bacterium]|nr:DUF4124 domain-containing protein [Gammaproteobacteria bacterium]